MEERLMKPKNLKKIVAKEEKHRKHQKAVEIVREATRKANAEATRTWAVNCPLDARNANARLMAAAPDLLEALQEIIAAADGEGWSQIDAGFTKARAAVAKALGND